jgi:hypothetical protein
MRREQNRSQKYISSIEGKFERGETVCLCSWSNTSEKECNSFPGYSLLDIERTL